MSKFNEKTSPVVPTKVNDMGEKAFELSAKEELVATVLTTFLSNSYYEKEKAIVERIKTALAKVDPLFAAKLAVYARDDANMRSVTHLISGEIAGRVSGTEWGKRFYRRIAIRPDDMAEVMSYYYNGVNQATSKKEGTEFKSTKFPNAMKKGFREKLMSMDPYLIDKYKMTGKQFSLIKLLNLLHPKPTQSNEEAFKRLKAGLPLDDLYSSKILEKEMSKTGGKGKTEKEVAEAKQEAITSVIGNAKGMPIFNLVRNLCNIILYAPDQVDEVCKQLVIPAKIEKSRLLPFRFLSAFEEVDKLTYSVTTPPKTVMFEDEVATRVATRQEFGELKAKVLNALEKAMDLSCANIPKLEGRTAILIDHSGSVRGDGGGASLVSTFSKTTSSMIANLFGTMLMMGQDNVYIGLFGDKLIPVRSIDRSKGILRNAKEIHDLGGKCGGGTEAGIYDFFISVVEDNVKMDNVIIFSDMVIGSGGATTWYGHGTRVGKYSTDHGDFQHVFKDFRKLNPLCNVVSVDIRQTKGTSVFDKSMNVTQVAGWSNKIFDLIGGATRGYKDLIDEIEKIVI